MNETVCYSASKVTSYSPFPAEPSFLCIYIGKGSFQWSSKLSTFCYGESER